MGRVGAGQPHMSDIYLVDDHLLMRDSLKAVLEDAGHRVVGESADPTQALAELQALKPALLLLDLNLDTRSGFELLEVLRQRAPGVRTVVLTMSAQPRDIAEARRLGALGYVLKGAPARDLLAAVDAVLQGHLYLAADLALLAAGHAVAPALGLAALSPRERQVVLGVVRGACGIEPDGRRARRPAAGRESERETDRTARRTAPLAAGHAQSRESHSVRENGNQRPARRPGPAAALSERGG